MKSVLPACRHELLCRIKPACAHIETSVAKGTGYLVSERCVATCEHVVRGLPGGTKVSVRFGDNTKAPVRIATVLKSAPEHDSALLQIEDPPEGVAPLQPQSQPCFHSECLVYGFPEFADGLGVPFTGRVMDPDAEIPGQMRGMAVYSEILGANPPQSVGGYSGSPVLIGDRVVGHVSSVLGARGAMRQPHMGYIYVVPMSGVAALLGTARDSVPPPSRPPASERRIRELGASFFALQFSASSEEVIRVLEKASDNGILTLELRVYAAEHLIALALPERALEVLSTEDSPRAEQLRALALSLRGDSAAALAGACALEHSAEVLGIQGGILKRRWLDTHDRAYLRSAYATYLRAYMTYGDHYPGINTAACALYLGQIGESNRIAGQIARRLAAKLERDKWEQASLAEAYLLSGSIAKAKEQYALVAEMEPNKTRDYATLRSQAMRDLEYLGLPKSTLQDILPRGRRAAAFSCSRSTANLSSDEGRGAYRQIADAIDDNGVHFGYCSAMTWAELHFIDALLDRAGEVFVFLPYPPSDIIGQRADDPTWQSHFNQVLERLSPHRITVLPPRSATSNATGPVASCNAAIENEVRKQASLLGELPELIALVRQGEPADLEGDAHAVANWVARGVGDVVRIEIA